ncbi:FGGY family carbohydrate kinase [Halomarina halobia]|uniref:FGGY family carbohydrate kinase n=1 Tax=Halomarina halobia TaxID=3033386 RepID=A0ABD6AEJ7_9EURY|nr:FGGY-family carbohydrate kinase [Halomarina sp. PSR21]
MTEAIIGIDAGTSTIKVVAFTLDGDQLVRRTRPTPVVRPGQGLVEQDMAVTWERTAAAISDVVAVADGDVAAVGVTGQGGGCWLVDADGDPVRNAVLWSDGRAADYVDEWRTDGTYDAVFDTFGYGLFPGMALPIFRWLREEAPDAVDRTTTAFACKDWLKFRLTGERTTDPSDASLMHYRPADGEFDAAVVERLGAGGLAERIPELARGTDVVGRVTESAAAATDLPAGTPVISGVMDVAAAAFGSGAATPGSNSVVLGTTLQCQTVLAEPVFEPPRAGYTLALGVEGLGLRAMGAMAGTPNLDWATETLGVDVDRAETMARAAPVGADGVAYHPYLSAAGEKAPFVAPGARAQFTGLTPEHGREHLLRAVYEGVALAARDCCAALPGDVDRLSLSGGGARSELWCQLFADCLDATVAVPAGEEFGARGVALLAGLATDAYDDLTDAIDRTTRVKRSYEPRPVSATKYDRWFEFYRESREAMVEVWKRRRRALATL